MSITLHTLAPNEGANVRKKRLGRGHGTGRHKTSGKGMKGQKARTGHHGIPKPGFEGGQTALARRVPKRGFNNFSRQRYAIVSVAEISSRMADAKVIESKTLYQAGLVPRDAKVKILGGASNASMPRAAVRVHGISESARKLLEDAGCTIEVLETKVAPSQE